MFHANPHMSLVPIAYFHFIFWGPDFHLCKPNFHHLRTPTGKLPQTPLTTIFPNPSLSAYAHGVFGSWVNTVNHFPGTDRA